MEQDDGFFGMPQPLLMMTGLFLALAFGAVLMFGSGGFRDPPEPPTPLFGCYSATTGPDILVEESKLTVLQDPSIELKSALKYQKGWVFEINQGLDVSPAQSGSFNLLPRPSNGEFLIISREGEVASPVPSFTLYDRNSEQQVRYTRSGVTCRPATGL